MEGELDNTKPGTVTGWIRFYREGKEPLTVTLDLAGNCHRDLQGRRFRIFNSNPCEHDPERKKSCVDGLDPNQAGTAGDITAGDEPRDYVTYPYVEWYSDSNGRVVLELERSQLEILTPEPAFQPQEEDRRKQQENMKKFLTDMVEESGAKFGAVVGGEDKKKPKKGGGT